MRAQAADLVYASGISGEALVSEGLMRAVARHDETAFAALYDRYSAGAYSVALRICGDRETAEDVVADSFLLVWKKAASFDGSRGELGGWLGRIVRNRALDAQRARVRRPQTTLDQAEGAAADAPDVTTRLDVASALAVLSPAQQQVLELAYFSGLCQREIAARLGMPLGTVKSHTRRGLDLLRERFRST